MCIVCTVLELIYGPLTLNFEYEPRKFLIVFKNIHVALFNHHMDQLGTLKSMLMHNIVLFVSLRVIQFLANSLLKLFIWSK